MGRDDRSSEAQDYRKFYKRARWVAIRDRQLRQKPLCEWCHKRGRIKAATICHHNDPRQKLDPNTFHDGPFTSLCKDCHDGEAQMIEAIGFSTRIGSDGWPVDDCHPANKSRHS